MKIVISSLLALTVFFTGCEGKRTNPNGVDLPSDKEQSYIAVEAPVWDGNNLQDLNRENEGISEITFDVPVFETGTKETINDVNGVREPDVIYVPTPQDVVDKMLELVNVTKDDLLYDLGCGDGRIVVTAAKMYGCKAVGYDIDPQRVKESLKNVDSNNVGHLVKIEQKDIFTLDLSEANVVTLYLLPSLNVKLIPQLEKLKSGSRIVSHDFRMKGIKPEKVVRITSSEDDSVHKIFFWTTPLKKKQIKKKGLESEWKD